MTESATARIDSAWAQTFTLKSNELSGQLTNRQFVMAWGSQAKTSHLSYPGKMLRMEPKVSQ